MSDSNNTFNVYTVEHMDSADVDRYSHWAKDLVMYITKDGHTIKLDSNEIQQLVKSLPRTVGGSY